MGFLLSKLLPLFLYPLGLGLLLHLAGLGAATEGDSAGPSPSVARALV